MVRRCGGKSCITTAWATQTLPCVPGWISMVCLGLCWGPDEHKNVYNWLWFLLSDYRKNKSYTVLGLHNLKMSAKTVRWLIHLGIFIFNFPISCIFTLILRSAEYLHHGNSIKERNWMQDLNKTKSKTLLVKLFSVWGLQVLNMWYFELEKQNLQVAVNTYAYKIFDCFQNKLTEKSVSPMYGSVRTVSRAF